MTKHTTPTDSPLTAIEQAEIAASNADRDTPRIPWGARRALGVELDRLYETLWRDVTEEHRDRAEEIEEILGANPLDSYSSEEIDKYNLFHFGDASGRPAEKQFVPGSGVQDMGRSRRNPEGA